MANSRDYLGRSKRSAQDLAERQNLIFRLIRVDSETFFEYPKDIRHDRICVEIERGQVIKAEIT